MKSSDRECTEYENLTDEELITRLRDGEKEIELYLLEKYKNLVRSKAKNMYILGAEHDDLLQEGTIGLVKAIRDYDAGRDASFFTFAELCITRQIYNAVTASGRKKHMPLNSYISFSQEEGNEEDGGRELGETFETENSNPESMLIDRENVANIEHIIDTELSPLEKQVLELQLTGMGYKEIAKVLSKDEKSTDNALQRAKQKIRKALKQ